MSVDVDYPFRKNQNVPDYPCGIRRLEPYGTNSTFFTECCGVAICDDERCCPKCGKEIAFKCIVSLFSHRQLDKKDKQDKHEMLHKIGQNWAKDLDPIWKNGAFIYKNENRIDISSEVIANFEKISSFFNKIPYLATPTFCSF